MRKWGVLSLRESKATKQSLLPQRVLRSTRNDACCFARKSGSYFVADPLEILQQDMDSMMTLLACVLLAACPQVQLENTGSKLPPAPARFQHRRAQALPGTACGLILAYRCYSEFVDPLFSKWLNSSLMVL